MRVRLSDGSERCVRSWGLLVLPERDALGRPLEVVTSEVVEDRVAQAAAHTGADAPRHLTVVPPTFRPAEDKAAGTRTRAA